MKKSVNINLLQEIEQVDVPPFLFTRIQQRIESVAEIKFSKPATWALSFSLLLLLIFNISIGSKSNAGKQDAIKELVSEMNLMTSNNLYHE